MKFSVQVSWTETRRVEVEAQTAQEALEKARRGEWEPDPLSDPECGPVKASKAQPMGEGG